MVVNYNSYLLLSVTIFFFKNYRNKRTQERERESGSKIKAHHKLH